MPSVSKKQHNLMAAVAYNPKFAKKVGIPQSVGEDFVKADKGKQFKRGGEMAESKKMVKKEVAFMKAKGAPKSMVKHEEKEMVMKKGGCVKMAKGGSVKEARMEPAKMEKIPQGNKKFGEHVIQKKGATKGKNLGDAGKTVGIQSGARGMKRGGKC
jgi:hypothetical protein